MFCTENPLKYWELKVHLKKWKVKVELTEDGPQGELTIIWRWNCCHDNDHTDNDMWIAVPRD